MVLHSLLHWSWRVFYRSLRCNVLSRVLYYAHLLLSLVHYRHPLTVVFHMLFRSVALICYIFNFIIPLQFTASVLSIILLLAIDFWVVKNVSGRLLAGLRWWNKVEQDGSSNWLFESRSVSSFAHNSNCGSLVCQACYEQ